MKAWAPALVLATFGVLLTAGVVGVLASLTLGLSLVMGLLLGSVIGSTDAAATFMLLQRGSARLKVRDKQTILLESGVNDPIAIFLTMLFVGIVDHGAESVGWAELLLPIQQLGLGAVLGILGGGVIAWIGDRLPLQPGLRAVFVLSGGMVLFGATAWLGGSGFLAVYLTGIMIRSYSHVIGPLVMEFHDGLAWLSQIGLFLMLGLLVTPRELPAELPRGLLVAALLMFVARPLAVIACLTPLRFAFREQLFVGWVGLRGAVPIFLAIIPVISPGPVQHDFFNMVFVVVIASLVLQGWTIPLAARIFGVEEPAATDTTNNPTS